MSEHTRIVVYIIVRQGSKILMGMRKGTFGSGEWSMPAGHLEFNEEFEECAARELREETGLQARQFKLVALRNQHPYTSAVSGATPRHYVILGLEALDWSGTPTVMEPDRCAGWDWFDPAHLPEPLFEPAGLILACCQSGELYLPSVQV